MDTALWINKINDTSDLLYMLNDAELEAVNSVVSAFAIRQTNDSPFKPLSEDRLFEDIDEGIAEADQGKYEGALTMAKALRKELRL
jgi:hypothetical protein